MKIAINHYDAELTYDFGHDDVTLDELMEKFYKLTASLGYCGPVIFEDYLDQYESL